MDLVTYYRFCWYFMLHWGLLFNFLLVLMSLVFKFSLWVGSFLAMFGDLRMTILLLWWLLRAC